MIACTLTVFNFSQLKKTIILFSIWHLFTIVIQFRHTKRRPMAALIKAQGKTRFENWKLRRPFLWPYSLPDDASCEERRKVQAQLTARLTHQREPERRAATSGAPAGDAGRHPNDQAVSRPAAATRPGTSAVWRPSPRRSHRSHRGSAPSPARLMRGLRAVIRYSFH
jgi:hypothetical protein